MRAIAIASFIFLSAIGHAQTTINNYKYVIVPVRYSFSKADNQYELNTLTKSFLEDKGFKVFMANESLPPDLAANNCLALQADIDENNSMFATKLTLVLRDCRGNSIFKGKEGKSREKDFKTSYTMALTDAFSSMNVVYKYEGEAVSTQPATPGTTQTPPPAATTQAPAASTPVDNAGISGMLYAQPTPSGFQLVDTSPKKVMTLLKTSMPDYFIVDDKAQHAVVFRKNEEWHYEYYSEGKLVSKKLQIKF